MKALQGIQSLTYRRSDASFGNIAGFVKLPDGVRAVVRAFVIAEIADYDTLKIVITCATRYAEIARLTSESGVIIQGSEGCSATLSNGAMIRLEVDTQSCVQTFTFVIPNLAARVLNTVTAAIHYTTNGYTPTTSGVVYRDSEPVASKGSVVLPSGAWTDFFSVDVKKATAKAL